MSTIDVYMLVGFLVPVIVPLCIALLFVKIVRECLLRSDFIEDATCNLGWGLYSGEKRKYLVGGHSWTPYPSEAIRFDDEVSLSNFLSDNPKLSLLTLQARKL